MEDGEVADELLDAYEVQKKAKANVRKHYRSYTESKKRVRDIKRSRQPYMPVVAIPQDVAGMTAGAGAATGQVQPTFRYDRKGHGKESGHKNATGKPRKEEVHMMSSEVLTEFSRPPRSPSLRCVFPRFPMAMQSLILAAHRQLLGPRRPNS